MITRGQRHLAMTAPNDPVHMAHDVHCKCRRVTDRHRELNIVRNSQHLVHLMQPKNV